MRVLLGVDGAAPAGRLTTTVYPAEFVNRNMTDMSLKNLTCVIIRTTTHFSFEALKGFKKFSALAQAQVFSPRFISTQRICLFYLFELTSERTVDYLTH